MTRIGIVGLGFMGRTHYDTYQKIPSAQVVAVADRRPQAGRRRPVRRVGERRRGRHDSSCRWTGSQGTPTGGSWSPMRTWTWSTSASPTPAHVEVDAGGARGGQARALREAAGPHQRRRPEDRRRGGLGARAVHARDVHAVLAGVGVAQAGRGRGTLRQGPRRRPSAGSARSRRLVPRRPAAPAAGCSTCTSTTPTSSTTSSASPPASSAAASSAPAARSTTSSPNTSTGPI